MRILNIYEERQPNGQWIKSVVFKLPIIEHDMKLSLDNDDSVECVCLLSNRETGSKHKERGFDDCITQAVIEHESEIRHF